MLIPSCYSKLRELLESILVLVNCLEVITLKPKVCGFSRDSYDNTPFRWSFFVFGTVLLADRDFSHTIEFGFVAVRSLPPILAGLESLWNLFWF